VVIVSLLAIALFFLPLSNWGWKWFTSVEPSVESTFAVNNKGISNHQDLSLSEPTGSAAVKERTQDAIPLSSHNLELTGAIVTPVESFALIRTNGGPELLYTIDQDIISGVVLRAVYADHVLIRHAGSTKSLKLKMYTPTSLGGTNSTASESTPQTATLITPEEIDQRMLKAVFKRQALMVPNAGGGFQVSKIRPNSPYMQIGLRTGDVITSVNGQAVNSMDDIIKLHQLLEVSEISLVNIGIQRASKNEALQ
jgi:general secretion pathway protein C